jgi:molybdate transport system ATP-binding protein
VEARIALIELEVRLPLAHFTLDVRCSSDAKVTALVGPSGSGKTSLIESIAGLRKASGRIVLDSVSLLDRPPERRNIGYVPQDVALFPHLRVRDNICYGGRDSARFDSLCDTLELGPLLDRSPATLSGGERQRVAIARALMTNPRLLLLDEPLASVDQPLRERILMYLRRVRDLGVPMIYVTHQPFEAIALSSWCIVLREGRVAGEGRPRDVLYADAAAGDVENVFEVSNPRHDPAKGITRVTTADGLELVLPHDRVADVTFPLIVRISGEEIVVFGERPSAVSSRNVIEGTIFAIKGRDGAIDFTVAAPAPIRVRVTRAAADDLRLAEGSRVWLAMRSRAFRIVG